MTSVIDTISPLYIGDQKISIEVDSSCKPLMAFKRIIINIDYSDALPEGVILPLELIVQPGFGGGGEANGYKRKVFRRTAPESYTFTVPSSGDYLVVVREIFHNQWRGSQIITVGGDPVSSRSARWRQI